MGDYFSAEAYIMLDNENFPLSLLHFSVLQFSLQTFVPFHKVMYMRTPDRANFKSQGENERQWRDQTW